MLRIKDEQAEEPRIPRIPRIPPRAESVRIAGFGWRRSGTACRRRRVSRR